MQGVDCIIAHPKVSPTCIHSSYSESRLFKSRRRSRGQGLVEFTILLPLLLILLAVSIDFGRLFTGWVGLNNATRIAANYGAAVPNPPGGWGIGSEYDTTVRREASTANCALPAGPLPAPVFTPDTKVGSEARATLTCKFHLLTPILGSVISNVAGDITMGATSVFIVRSGGIPGVPDPPPDPCVAPDLVVPNLVGLTVDQARTAWTGAGFTGPFNPSTGVPNKIVTGQIPDVGACRAPTQTVFVEHT